MARSGVRVVADSADVIGTVIAAPAVLLAHRCRALLAPRPRLLLWSLSPRLLPRAKGPAVAKIQITWVRSQIGSTQDQRRTIKALGLKRLRHVVEHEDSPTVRGMVHKVRHLIAVELGDQSAS